MERLRNAYAFIPGHVTVLGEVNRVRTIAMCVFVYLCDLPSYKCMLEVSLKRSGNKKHALWMNEWLFRH